MGQPLLAGEGQRVGEVHTRTEDDELFPAVGPQQVGQLRESRRGAGRTAERGHEGAGTVGQRLVVERHGWNSFSRRQENRDLLVIPRSGRTSLMSSSSAR